VALGLLAWLVISFPGRLLLLFLSMAWPASQVTPLVLASGPPVVERVAFPSPSGRTILADIYRPAGARLVRPSMFITSPAGRGGLENPVVQRLGDSMARLGYVAMAAFPEGERIPYASPDDIDDAEAALRYFRGLSDADPKRSIGLAVSYGSGPLLLAAERMPPQQRPERLLVLGGYADLREIIRFGTTATYRYGDVTGSLEPHPYLLELLDVTLTTWAGPQDAPGLQSLIRAEHGAVPEGLSPNGRAIARLLLNRDPARFEELYQQVPAELRRRGEALSIPNRLETLDRPTFILQPAEDRMVPPSEGFRLRDSLPPGTPVEFELLPGLGHEMPDLGEFLNGNLPRSLWRTHRTLRRALFPTRGIQSPLGSR
jgi:pimeloyl-ACP methyl ester carboxylesterase